MAILIDLYLFMAKTVGTATGIIVFLLCFQYLAVFMVCWVKGKFSRDIKLSMPEWLEAINYEIETLIKKLLFKQIPTIEEYHDMLVNFWKRQEEDLLFAPGLEIASFILISLIGVFLGVVSGFATYGVFYLAGLLLQFAWPFLLIAGIVALLICEAQPLFTLIGMLRTMTFYVHKHEGDEIVHDNTLPRF